MLADDHREEAFLEGIGLALEDAEAVATSDTGSWANTVNPQVGQAGGEGSVGEITGFRGAADGIGGETFEAVLTDHDRSAFAFGEVVGQKEIAPGKDVRPNIQREFVDGKLGAVLDLPGARVEAGRGHGELAEDLLVEVCAEVVAGLGPVVGGAGVELAPKEIFAHLIGQAQQTLGVIGQVGDLPALAFVVVHRRSAGGLGGRRRARQLTVAAQGTEESLESASALYPGGTDKPSLAWMSCGVKGNGDGKKARARSSSSWTSSVLEF